MQRIDIMFKITKWMMEYFSYPWWQLLYEILEGRDLLIPSLERAISVNFVSLWFNFIVQFAS